MKVHHRIAAVALVVTAAVGAVGWGAGSANAGEVTLQYQCSLPPFPTQDMTLRLTWNAPDSVPVGQRTPAVPVNGTATMGDVVTQTLGLIGATTVEGTLDATGVVVAPEGDLHVAVSVTVPRTDVPASGPITIAASGTAPVLVFHQPGHAMITADSGFMVHIVPRDANGNLTFAGELDASCALDAGQNNVLTSFDITASRPPPPSTTRGSVGPPQSSTTGPTATTTASVPSTTADSRRTVAPTSTSPAPGIAVGSVVRRALVDVYRAGGGIVAAGIGVLGCVWWLKRRRRRRGRGH